MHPFEPEHEIERLKVELGEIPRSMTCEVYAEGLRQIDCLGECRGGPKLEDPERADLGQLVRLLCEKRRGKWAAKPVSGAHEGNLERTRSCSHRHQLLTCNSADLVARPVRRTCSTKTARIWSRSRYGS
jgi:hypothetical protein